MKRSLKIGISILVMIISVVVIIFSVMRANTYVAVVKDVDTSTNTSSEINKEDAENVDENSQNYTDGNFPGAGETDGKETNEISYNKIGYTFLIKSLIFISIVAFMGAIFYLIFSKAGLNAVFEKNKFLIIYLVITIVIALIVFFVMMLVLKYNSKLNTFIEKMTSDIGYSSTSDLHINNSSWNYDEENDVYWQIGLVYCTDPVDVKYESLGIYVPGEYFKGTQNEDGKYTVTLNDDAVINGYTVDTAPILFPINTAGYSSQAAPTSYSYDGLKEYLDEGYIYVYAGCRGKNNGENYSGGAPWGVTDLKAAIRYLRYNKDSIPGNEESIFTCGMSAGGAQAAILGTSGDSESYTKYLESIGAKMTDDNDEEISDSVAGVITWCPITSLDYANEAYEWNMGQYSDEGDRSNDTWINQLSLDLASSFGTYINGLGLVDESGKKLELNVEKTFEKRYTTGTYATYILNVINDSLNNYLEDNFETADQKQEYINSLNEKGTSTWVKYDSKTEKATVSSIKDFSLNMKKATKDVGAFDPFDKSSAENYLFGTDTKDNLHWDTTLGDLLNDNKDTYSKYSNFDTSLIDEYEDDSKEKDSLKFSTYYRQNMYNPMNYINASYSGYGSSNVAKYWRIRSGISQTDTALTVEVNLYLALNQLDTIENLDFETVWGAGHVMAERTGTATENLINYIENCLEEEKTTISDHQILSEIQKQDSTFKMDNYTIIRTIDNKVMNTNGTYDVDETINVDLVLGDFITNSGYVLTVKNGEVINIVANNIYSNSEIEKLKENDDFDISNYDDALNDIYDKFYKQYNDVDIEQEEYYYDVKTDKLSVKLYYKATTNKVTTLKSASYEIKKSAKDKDDEDENVVDDNTISNVTNSTKTNTTKTNVTNTAKTNTTNSIANTTTQNAVKNETTNSTSSSSSSSKVSSNAVETTNSTTTSSESKKEENVVTNEVKEDSKEVNEVVNNNEV